MLRVKKPYETYLKCMYHFFKSELRDNIKTRIPQPGIDLTWCPTKFHRSCRVISFTLQWFTSI
jgi:hypothetical protein